MSHFVSLRVASWLLLCFLIAVVPAAAQLQTLEPTDSLKQRRDKTNANFIYHQNLITGFTAQQHSHANKSFLDLLPSSVPGAGSFLRSNGTSVEFSTDGTFITNLNASALATGFVPVGRLPVFIASGPSHTAGIVPDPGATTGATKFLREDATWAVPSLTSLSGVLPATGGGLGFGSFAVGDLFYANSTTTIAKLPIGSNGQALKVSAGLPVWENPSGGTSHNLLSSTHTDTTSASVVRGDLVVGQGATPTFQRLAIGASGTVLRTDGTDAAWGKITDAHVDAAAAIGWTKINKTGSSIDDLGDVTITGVSDGQVLQRVAGVWVNQTLSGSGITSLNGLTGGSQTFATGTSGTDLNISSSGTVHTFNVPNASATARGFVSTGPQTFAGDKTLNDDLTVLGTFTVGGGATVSKILTSNATLDFPNVPANSSEDLTVTVTGAAAGDAVFITANNAAAGVKKNHVFTGWVSGADQVKVRFSNLTSTSVDLASGSFRVVVVKF